MLRQQRRQQKAQRRHAASRSPRGLPRAGNGGRQRAVVIRVPKHLMAERIDSRRLMLDTLESLNRHLQRGAAKIKLDWSGVQRIYPGGMLMMIAHLELLAELWPGRIRFACPKGSLAAQLIRHFDLGAKFGVAADGNTPRHQSVLPWRFATGADVDGALIDRHITGFANRLASDVPDGLYRALSEATTNVQHHAYPESSGVPVIMKRWWLFSRVEEASSGKDGVIYLAFYDVGVGIPTSMRNCLQGLREHSLEVVRMVLSEFGIDEDLGQDAKLLRLAVEHTRTSTGLPFRGKGLPEMREFVVETSGGRMTIISGRAQYSVRSESPVAASVKCDRGILGTLILWSLPLKWKEATP